MSDRPTQKPPILNIPRIAINAEFQRLFWLNFSVPLLVCIAICYAFFGIFMTDGGKHDGYALMMVGGVGFWLSCIGLVVMLQRSISQDMQSKFWEQIRMSTLSAWQVAWTRLLIAPILGWAGVVIGLLMMTYGWIQDAMIGENDTIPMIDRLWLIASLFCSTVALACVFVANLLQSSRSEYEWIGSYIQLVLLFFVVGNVLLNDARFHVVMIDDLGSAIVDGFYVFLKCGIFLALMLFCLYRCMSYHLHWRSAQLSYLLCALIAPFFLWIPDVWLAWQNPIFRYNGFDPHILSTPNTLMIGLSSHVFLVYGFVCLLSVIAQDNRKEVFATAFGHLRQKAYRKALALLPVWVMLLPIFIITVLLLALAIRVMFFDPVGDVASINHNISKHLIGHLVKCVVYMAMLRVLYHIFSGMSLRFNRVTIMLVGLLVVYGMLQATL